MNARSVGHARPAMTTRHPSAASFVGWRPRLAGIRAFRSGAGSVARVGALLALLAIVPGSPWQSTPVAAQASPEATPGVVISADLCQVAPRPRADFDALMAPGATPGSFGAYGRGTPVVAGTPPTGGVPADPIVVAAVTDSMLEMAACLVAQDLPRFIALWSDDFFSNTLSGWDLRPLLDATPPALPTQSIPYPDFSTLDFHMLPDGRVAVTTRDAPELGTQVFVKVGDRYLADAAFNVPGFNYPVRYDPDE